METSIDIEKALKERIAFMVESTEFGPIARKFGRMAFGSQEEETSDREKEMFAAAASSSVSILKANANFLIQTIVGMMFVERDAGGILDTYQVAELTRYSTFVGTGMLRHTVNSANRMAVAADCDVTCMEGRAPDLSMGDLVALTIMSRCEGL